MTPAEALAAISAGLAGKLMRDWWEPNREIGNRKRIYILCPAAVGREGRGAREFTFFDILVGATKGRCTFLDGGLCKLHASGFKPLQCREALNCTTQEDFDPVADNLRVAKMWNTKEGRAAVQAWRAAVR